MNLNTLKSAVFCLCVTALLSSCQTTGPEVTDPPQKQASAIKAKAEFTKWAILIKFWDDGITRKKTILIPKPERLRGTVPIFMPNVPPTAKKYNMHSLTAAHRTLPLPSIVRITNLENGRSLVVRVNDRGPYARNRIVDVSKKVAQLLGFLEKGTAKVRVEVLEKESKNLKAALTGKALTAEVTAAPTTQIVRSGIGEDVKPLAAAFRDYAGDAVVLCR